MKIDVRRFRPTVASLVGSVVIVAALLIVLMATMGNQDMQLLKDQQEIERVVVRAYELTSGGTTMLPEPYFSDPTTAVPDEVVAQMNDRARESLSEVYSKDSRRLKTRVELSQREVARQEPGGFRDLGGGMRWMKNVTIEVNGDRAVFEADIRGWSKFIEQGRTFTPEATAHHRYVLVREDGTWKIAHEEFAFLPGEEP